MRIIQGTKTPRAAFCSKTLSLHSKSGKTNFSNINEFTFAIVFRAPSCANGLGDESTRKLA